MPRRSGRALTAQIRRIADVIVGGSRGIDFDPQFRGFLREQMAEYSLGRRTAANIAEADEQDSHAGASEARTRCRSSGVSTPAGGASDNATK